MKHRPIALAVALSMAAFVAVQLYIVTVFLMLYGWIQQARGSMLATRYCANDRTFQKRENLLKINRLITSAAG